ncbi:MAG TPA: hydroxysqualene dehydroxylase HpnE [Candidatus Polarisedimenticolia bacterium]|nr:hydroxysqualene dehydroxylase HpnE [Candidatus Polarisedimenticolia bacterium]
MTARGGGSPDVVVVGGGFAGLAAATALAEAGAKVTLCESRPHLGGRARSWIDPVTGSIIDNGQHLLMGCYAEMLRFLERIGAAGRVAWGDGLEVPYLDPGGRATVLRAGAGRIGALAGLLRFNGLPFGERLAAARVPIASRRDDPALEEMTVAQWLARLEQSAEARRRLWDPLAVAALNEAPERAAASGFAAALRHAFFSGPRGIALGAPRVGLSDLYVEPGTHYLRAHGGEVRPRAQVQRLLESGTRCSGVLLAGGERLEAGAVIAAVPPKALLELLPPALAADRFFARVGELRDSAILSVYLWYGAPFVERPYAALLGGFWQWVFMRDGVRPPPSAGKEPAAVRGGLHVVTLVRSAAAGDADRPKEALVRQAIEELRRYVPAVGRLAPRHDMVIKEKSATVSLTPGTGALRPTTITPLERFYLAGDWVATGIPATVESACLSGHAAARAAARP